jgi:hypothetical protein
MPERVFHNSFVQQTWKAEVCGVEEALKDRANITPQ